jgi:rRNA maturation endonuclease Nob1
MIPLALTLSALFAAALVYDLIIFRRRRRSGNPVVYRCDSCRHIYSVPHRTPLARCPKCGKQNEPVRE